MNTFRFSPLTNRTEEIVEHLLQQPELTQSSKDVFAFHLVLEELVSNIVQYAYSDPDHGDLIVELSRADGLVTIVLRDHGAPFNPLRQEPPDLSLPIEQRPIGGLGIHLVKSMMDGVDYRFEEGCNILTVVKRVEAAGSTDA